MPNTTSRFPTIKCWPYRIEFFQRPEFMGYELRVSLETRKHGGSPDVVTTRKIIHEIEMVRTGDSSMHDLINHMVREAIMELTRHHIDEHLRIE